MAAGMPAAFLLRGAVKTCRPNVEEPKWGRVVGPAAAYRNRWEDTHET